MLPHETNARRVCLSSVVQGERPDIKGMCQVRLLTEERQTIAEADFAPCHRNNREGVNVPSRQDSNLKPPVIGGYSTIELLDGTLAQVAGLEPALPPTSRGKSARYTYTQDDAGKCGCRPLTV